MEISDQLFTDAKIIQDLFYNKLKFCACGNPEDTLLLIKNVLNIIDKYHKEDINYYTYNDILHDTFEFAAYSKSETKLTHIQNGIVQFVLYYLDEIGLIEHGGSIGGAWITKLGEDILEILTRNDDLGKLLDIEIN